MQVHGDWIWLHDRAYPVTEDGSVRMVAGIAEDITEDVEKERKLKKQIKETERISKIKSDFVARTTHDLRTPLNAILGHVALLWETDLSPEQKRDLERIRMAGQSMVHLTNDILDLDRVESGKLELHEEPIRIRALIDDVMSLFRPKVSEQDLRLSCSVGEAVPEWVRVDPDRLKQILVNLVGNALKFTVEGHVDVSVAAEGDRDEELVLAFEVSDTGPGIEPEKQEEIFRERKKGSDHAAISTTGAGIGLSITQNLVHAMDGEISVDSVPGEGSTFRFTVRCESVEEKPEDGKRRPEQASLDGTRVLVVDDSGPIRSMLTRFLDNAGMEAESVATGAEAVERLTGEGSEKTFDVVFLDQGLDDCSGFDVLEKVDGAEPGIDTERIYILSGEARAKIRSERPDVPVAGVLEKPVSQSQLVRSVQFVLTTFENEASETPAEREEIQLSAPRDLHVMLVDDDPEAREILARFLSDAVEKITTVSRGREAVRNRFEKMPDVVLMDLEMPEMNGLDATEAIREREWEQGHNSVPIIFQTARAMKQDEEKCFEAGGDAFLRKPVNRAELLSTLESVLEEGVSSR